MAESRYVEGVVANYNISTEEGSPGYVAAGQLHDILTSWAGRALNGIYLSGSYAKHTAIRGEADVDLLISIVPENIQSMSDLYWGLYTYLKNKGYSVRKQDVSIGLTYGKVKADLIPAKKNPGYTNDHTIFSTRRDSWTKTNIKQHIDIVKDSGRAIDIKAGKIWKQCHNLDFPSFYLELSVLNALRGSPRGEHTNNFLTFLEYLRDSFIHARIIDPANSNNIVSDDLNNVQKLAIVRAANLSRSKEYWREIIW